MSNGTIEIVLCQRDRKGEKVMDKPKVRVKGKFEAVYLGQQVEAHLRGGKSIFR